jgi:hypothetical protein
MDRIPIAILLAMLALAAASPSRSIAQGLPPSSAPAAPVAATTPTNPPGPNGAAPVSSPQFEYGVPYRVVDAVGWTFGIPQKIILWDRRAVNHNVSPETARRVAQYVNDNALSDTKVRVNEYDPAGEWQRLITNKRVGAGWRYTFGAFGTLAYTLFPGRLFGADGYNPYTDTVYIYSDIPAVVEEQTAYAKLVHARSYPGTYVALTSLPIVRLWPEKQAKDDVLNYTAANGSSAERAAAIHAMYPEYGAEIASEATRFVPGGILLTAAGAGLGHAAAHLDAKSDASTTASAPSSEWPARDAAREVTPASFDR